MTQRTDLRPDGEGLKVVKIQVSGFDFPRSHGNGICTQKPENPLRHVGSRNGNSIVCSQELSL
jgi:hypothetical protein